MPSLTQLLKATAIGLALTSLAACHPTYVRESYHETYVSAYRPMPAYAPVQYYPSMPVYVERRTVVVPRVVVTSPREVYSDDHHQQGRDGHARNQHDQGRDGGKTKSSHVAQQSGNQANQLTSPRDERRDRGSDRRGPRGKDD